MVLSHGFDSGSETAMITVTTNLLETYFNNFETLLFESPLPRLDIRNLKVVRQSSDTAVVTFNWHMPPVDTEEVKDLSEEDRDNIGKTMGIDKDSISGSVRAIKLDENDLTNPLVAFKKFLEKFVYLSMRNRLGNTEFIPLSGYPKSDLQHDLMNALSDKRDFCIVETFNDYKKNANNHFQDSFSNLLIKYGTSDWADISILIYQGKFKELTSLYKPLLKNTVWI